VQRKGKEDVLGERKNGTGKVENFFLKVNENKRERKGEEGDI